MKIIWLIVIGMLIGCPSVHAQRTSTNQGLTPGDTVPKATLTHLIHAKTPTLNLSDLRGKLVILDFWDTWCTSCIFTMPKLDSLQKQFSDKIRILAITDQGHDLVTDFLAKNKIARQVSLTIVTDDTLLSRWFPHRSVPHEVWISPEGTVLSATTSGEITAAHIQQMLQGKPLNLLQKIDRPNREPLFSANYLPKHNLLHYSILLKGYLPGIPGTYRHSNFGQVVINGVVNRPLLDLYTQVAKHYVPHFSDKQIIFEVTDPSQLDYPQGYDYTWLKQHVYSYEIILPKKEKDSLYTYMLQDLNRYSDYYGRIETREQPCLILAPKSGNKISPYAISQQHVSPSDSSNLHGFNAESIIPWLMSLKYLRLPIIQETSYSGKLFLDAWPKPRNRAALDKMLAGHGLKLIKGHRSLPALIISDHK